MSDQRTALFESILAQRVVIFDGAMGTSIHALDLPLSDYRDLENCNEILNLTRPDAIAGIHSSFFEVGCDVIETNTFGGMKHVLAEFDLAEQTHAINFAAAQIAVRAAAAASTARQPRFAAGSLGPGTKLVTLRQISYDELFDSYHVQSLALLQGGVDLMIIETCQDILQSKCAIYAVLEAMRKTGRRTPLIVQVTMETTGTMLVGTDIAGALTAIEAYPEVDVIGLNCATGPQEMSPHVRYLAANCTRRLSVMPNAGLPQLVNGQPYFPLSPEELARWLREFVIVDGVNIVGGCCGTTPRHLRAVVQTLRGAESASPARRAPASEPAVSSLYQAVPMRQDNSFLIVGERCNTNGSRKFKQLLADANFDGCVAMALEQVKEEGAHVIDVCVDYVGRDGVPDMHNVVERFTREVTAPLMLDSTQLDVLEAGLKLAGGKCIINSVNLEDGEEKLARVARLCRQYGAAVVALTIDEDPTEAMAKTAERKLAIATRIRDLLVERHGLRDEDIFWDCLTFPITTGNDADRRLGLETLEGIQRVMQRYPRCQSILGLSNISFGLQPLARVVLNSVFLHEARQRGLTAAIVHAGKILPRTQISDDRWNAALDLIYDRREQGDPLTRFIGFFGEGEQLTGKQKLAELPIEERLRQRIIDGNRVGLEADLEQARARYAPLEIVNTFLLDGMKVVGELFGSGQMQLPFVLKSAEAMKAAVAALEPFMEKSSGASRGKIVLATVRGDVHDIGKNLVDIILSNNGYTVYNLGIKQPVANVISALRAHAADAIGLSGLLVKSTLVMRDDLHVLNEQQISVPVILGGAALTRRYVEDELRQIYKGQLFYAKDAFEGLHLMGQIVDQARDAQPRSAAAASSERPAATPALAAAGSAGRAEDARTESVLGAPVNGDDARPAPTGNDIARGAPGAHASAAAGARPLKNLELELEQRFGLVSIGDTEDADLQAAEASGAGSAPAAPSSHPRRSPRAPRSEMTYLHAVPAPPFWGARVVESIPLRAVLAYLNEVMLFQVQWAFRKKGRTPEQFKRYIDLEVRPIYRELVERCERERIITPAAIYGYWPCNSEGDDLIVYAPDADRPPLHDALDARSHARSAEQRSAALAIPPREPLRALARFTFPRQSKPPFWCLSDFWRPVEQGVDVVAFQIVTAGRNVSEVARDWFARNEYQQYLFLHGLGVETAEAAAEYIHKQVRMQLGVAGQDAREIPRLFQQGYQGSRYSFGYPACPRLEDQARLMELLEPGRIGITLSEEFQLDPEQSTSAIVAYHPAARYFNVR